MFLVPIYLMIDEEEEDDDDDDEEEEEEDVEHEAMGTGILN